MKEEGLGGVFIRHLVMAIPWGIISILVFLVAVAILKGHVKDTIQYGVQTAVQESFQFAKDKGVTAAVKNNVKKGLRYAMREALDQTSGVVLEKETFARIKNKVKQGVAYAAATGRNEVKCLVTDPDVKQQVKKAIEHGGNAFKEAASQPKKQ